jgi:hypothetical protein
MERDAGNGAVQMAMGSKMQLALQQALQQIDDYKVGNGTRQDVVDSLATIALVAAQLAGDNQLKIDDAVSATSANWYKQNRGDVLRWAQGLAGTGNSNASLMG